MTHLLPLIQSSHIAEGEVETIECLMIVSTDSEVIFEKLVVGGGALRFWRQLRSFF